MKRILLTIIPFCILLSAFCITPRQVPNVQAANARQWVSDPASLLSPDALRQANATLDRINRDNTTEICAVIVDNLSDQDPDQFATELFELWGIGRRDRENGLLLLISRDDRRAVIRTGRGMEIAMTDGRAGSIIRHDIIPNMKNGDIDSATLAAINSIGQIAEDPTYYDDLHSDIAPVTSRGSRGSAANPSGNENFFRNYILFAILATIALTAIIIYTILKNSKADPVDRYTRLDRLRLPALMLIPLALGLGLIPFLLLWLVMRHTRLKRHNCPNCGTRMHRVDEEHDNDYLTPAQDMEERVGSVDYDVWLCPNCNETDIIPYINRRSSFTTCPACGARAETLQANRIMRQPTTSSEGLGTRIYHCHNCGRDRSVPYTIAKIVTPPVIITGGGGRGGFGGGGSFGGGFGGGGTSGGGASGGW